MKQFINDYFNIKNIIRNKREYKQQMERVNHLPKDYQLVYKKIQKYMWQFVSGAGYDMMQIQYELLDLFEEGASHGKSVLEITGDDVAHFVDDLLQHTRTYTQDWKTTLNQEIHKKLNKI